MSKFETWKCRFCGSSNTGSSPTGVWCNDCGLSDPGPKCLTCGRDFVGPKHIVKPGGELCSPVKLKDF